jgi:YggT family protein
MTAEQLIAKTFLILIGAYVAIIIVRILLTWFPTVGWVQQVTSSLSVVTDPYLNLFRNLVPPVGGFDLSTILAVIVLQVVQSSLQKFACEFLGVCSTPGSFF